MEFVNVSLGQISGEECVTGGNVGDYAVILAFIFRRILKSAHPPTIVLEREPYSRVAHQSHTKRH